MHQKKIKMNNYPSKIKTSFNISNNNNTNFKYFGYNNTNRERTNLLFDERNNSNINDSMSKYINNIYEDKITKLKDEIKELKQEKEKIKSNLVLFISLIKKYSNKLSILFDKNNINNYENKEIMQTFFSLNDFIEKIEINNFSIEDNIKIKKLFALNDINESEEIEKNVNDIITKYEAKINILMRQNKEILAKNKFLKNENNILKQQSLEDKNIKENMLNKLSMMKEINNNLEKKNKILDSKCRSYFNQSTRNKCEHKNFEDEIDYKNKNIKYSENLIYNKDFDQNDEIFKKINDRNMNSINKIMDLKKNLKKVINVTKNINVISSDENEKSCNLMNSYEKNNKNKAYIENGNNFLNDKTIASMYSKANNSKVKDEIEILDKEIETIQKKLENMIKND